MGLIDGIGKIAGGAAKGGGGIGSLLGGGKGGGGLGALLGGGKGKEGGGGGGFDVGGLIDGVKGIVDQVKQSSESKGAEKGKDDQKDQGTEQMVMALLQNLLGGAA